MQIQIFLNLVDANHPMPDIIAPVFQVRIQLVFVNQGQKILIRDLFGIVVQESCQTRFFDVKTEALR